MYGILLTLVLVLATRFAIALWNFDDDGMFIYGMCLMAITCTIIATSLLAVTIEAVWKTKKKTIKKKKTDKAFEMQTIDMKKFAPYKSPISDFQEGFREIEVDDRISESETIKIIDGQKEKGYLFVGKFVNPQNMKLYLRFQREDK